jgi:hypothetical protein
MNSIATLPIRMKWFSSVLNFETYVVQQKVNSARKKIFKVNSVLKALKTEELIRFLADYFYKI